MSLSQDILEKKLDKVRRRIHLGANVNDFDPFGYTPLIIALMTAQSEAVELLLSHGADPNRPDLFGQPPLHWAVKSESANLCELLLKKGAFPNTISSYGEPILVYPLLKKDQRLIETLTQHGTDRTCAEDYILAKSLGHHFEMEGFGLFKNYNLLISLVDYQGFRLEFSVSHLLRQYEAHLASGKAKSPYAPQILDPLLRAQKMRLLKKALPSEQESGFLEFLGELNFIPMAFDGHAVSIAYSHNFVALCDRSQGKSETTTVYRMPRPLTPDQVSFLLYGKKNREFWTTLPKMLSWSHIASIAIPFQTVGNCSWANIEPAPILLEALLELENGGEPQPLIWLERYQQWSNWNKNNIIQQALVRTAQLKGDRRTALILNLFHLFMSSPDTLEKFAPLAELFVSEKAMIQSISYQHQIAKTPWWPKMERWVKKNGLRTL